MNMDISNYRREYHGDKIEILSHDPFEQFTIWFNEALSIFEKESFLDTNSMILSTVNKKLNVSSRVVLLKEMTNKGFIFYGNYKSQKGKCLSDVNNASLLFYWPKMNRQIRIEGRVKKISKIESDKYFYSRPILSQISAIISEQSKIIPNREFLENASIEIQNKLKNDNNFQLIRPKNWGGWILKPKNFEFWQGHENRLHDRIKYTLKKKEWKKYRLAP